MAIRRRVTAKRCSHDAWLSVAAAGLKRQVCEACGTVRVVHESDLTGSVARDRFSRVADDRLHAYS